MKDNTLYIPFRQEVEQDKIREWLNPTDAIVNALTIATYKQEDSIYQPDGRVSTLQLFKVNDTQGYSDIDPFRQWQRFDKLINHLAYHIGASLSTQDVWIESYPLKVEQNVFRVGSCTTHTMLYLQSGVWMVVSVERQMDDMKTTLSVLLAEWRDD